MLSKTSEFTEFNGNFEILNISLGVPEICGQKRPVFRPREIGGSLKQSRLTRLSGDSVTVVLRNMMFAHALTQYFVQKVYLKEI